MIGYRNQRREPGQGPLRLGTKLDFREDMYSLLYISLVHPVYKDWCDNEADKKEKDLDEVIAKVLKEEQEVEQDDSGEQYKTTPGGNMYRPPLEKEEGEDQAEEKSGEEDQKKSRGLQVFDEDCEPEGEAM